MAGEKLIQALQGLAQVQEREKIRRQREAAARRARKNSRFGSLGAIAGAGVAIGTGNPAFAPAGAAVGSQLAQQFFGDDAELDPNALIGAGISAAGASAANDQRAQNNRINQAILARREAESAGQFTEFDGSGVGPGGAVSGQDPLLLALEGQDLSTINPALLAQLVQPQQAKPTVLGPGQVAFDRQGKPLFGNPKTGRDIPRAGGGAQFRKGMTLPSDKSQAVLQAMGEEAITVNPDTGTGTLNQQVRGKFNFEKTNGRTRAVSFLPEKEPVKNTPEGLRVDLNKIRSDAINSVAKLSGREDLFDLISSNPSLTIEDFAKLGRLPPEDVEREFLGRLEAATRSKIPEAEKEVARQEIERIKKRQSFRKLAVSNAKAALKLAKTDQEKERIKDAFAGLGFDPGLL